MSIFESLNIYQRVGVQTRASCFSISSTFSTLIFICVPVLWYCSSRKESSNTKSMCIQGQKGIYRKSLRCIFIYLSGYNRIITLLCQYIRLHVMHGVPSYMLNFQCLLNTANSSTTQIAVILSLDWLSLFIVYINAPI